jgi:hypothetical protein
VGLEEAGTVDGSEGDLSDAAGREEVGVGDADEAEDGAEVGLDEVEGGIGRTGSVVATGGDDEGGLLAGELADGGSVDVGEGLAGAADLVDPELEDGGHAEVVHGSGDDELVGFEELVDEGVGEGEESALFGGVGVLGGVGGTDPGGVEDAEGGGVEVAGDDLSVGIGLLPALDKFVGEMAGDGGFGAERAGSRVGMGNLLTAFDG